MEDDDDEIQSQPSPAPNGRIAVDVAAPSPPPSNSLTLDFPIQHHHPKTPSSGGGREDCWSDAATAVLISAWGERHLELSRGNLNQKHWKDVADVVSSRGDHTQTPKTDVQCKNRIDTVKKKYKAEKARIAAGSGPSKWRFFDRLDKLIGTGAKLGISVGGAVRSSSKPSRKRPPVDTDEESDPENYSADSSDRFPPPPPQIRKKKNESEGNWGNLTRELSRAVLKLGEAYEQTETAKLQQLVELEKQRMEFAKDLELQRMQCFMKTQLELSQLKKKKSNGVIGTGITINNHQHLHVINSDNGNGVHNDNGNNSDSSN